MKLLFINKPFIILFLILILAAFLRFWHLSQTPPSLSHDEVAIGYNAWSVLTTGKDEYGTSYPILFRSFDDYKLPGYIYLTVLSEKIFGLTELAVRFPSAFLGTLTVFAFYFMVKELLRDNGKVASSIPLLAAAMLAISPWHINFSRAAFETNGSLFFIVLGTLFLLKSRKKPKYLVISSIIFVLSIYFYYTARVVIPIIILVYFFIYSGELFKLKKWIVTSFVIGFLLLLPLIPQMFASGLSRVNQVSIFEDKSLTNPYTQAILRNDNSPLTKIMYNRRIAYLQQFADNYLKNFAPDFYFTNGTGPMGLLYLWEIPFLLFGLYLVCRTNKKWKWLVLAWFFTVPLVGGLTIGQPNALRTLANVPMTALFSTIGLYQIYEILKKKKYFRHLAFAFLIIFIFFFIRFLTLYFDYNQNLTASSWGDGHKQAAQYVKENKDTYDAVYISGDYWRPYIYMLFYMKYQPSLYQQDGSRYGFSNIHFGQAIWDRGKGLNLAQDNLSLLVKKKTLFILSSSDFQSQQGLRESEHRPYILKSLGEINGVFVKPAFYAVELQ